jgi:hypothetical protein
VSSVRILVADFNVVIKNLLIDKDAKNTFYYNIYGSHN